MNGLFESVDPNEVCIVSNVLGEWNGMNEDSMMIIKNTILQTPSSRIPYNFLRLLYEM